jgi:hypothetical protein
MKIQARASEWVLAAPWTHSLARRACIGLSFCQELLKATRIGQSCLLLILVSIAASAAEPDQISYGPPRLLCNLANKTIDESSGLIASRHPGCLWTHNDSGDVARLYLTDLQGRDRGSCLLADTLAFDWEDLAAFEENGKRYLVAADTGNNVRASAVQMLHVVEEPPLDKDGRVATPDVKVLQTIHFSYEDDYRDCEAVAIDPADKTILLVSKEFGPNANVYRLPWPTAEASKSRTALVARKIATLPLLLATAMDISPDGRRAIVLTYLNAYEYTHRSGEDWAATFARPAREIPMPVRVQGESICYGRDGKTLYLTSEKLPTPLWEVPVADRP